MPLTKGTGERRERKRLIVVLADCSKRILLWLCDYKTPVQE
jgi:hypothetical protein